MFVLGMPCCKQAKLEKVQQHTMQTNLVSLTSNSYNKKKEKN